MKVDPGDRGVYRAAVAGTDLVAFEVAVRETDLLVLADRDLTDRVRDIVLTERDRLERYLAGSPAFLESLVPVPAPPTAPSIVRAMADAGSAAGVGPMAAVAGAICDSIARELAGETQELLIENGGDLYVRVARARIVGIYAGEGRGPSLGIRIRPESGPRGVCTSSGRIGHSLSFGDSAAATVIAGTCALADAAATAVGNRVRGRHGVRDAIAAARAIPGVLGAVVLRGGELGAWGEVELVDLAEVSS